MSGRILAKSLLPEPKTSLKCSITSLVSGTKLRFSKKKSLFPLLPSLSRKPLEAHHSPPLPRHVGRASASMRPDRLNAAVLPCPRGESGRERGLPRRAAGRAHPRGMADGWRVRKCHFRGLKHLRAVKIFPLARLACRQPGEAHLDVTLGWHQIVRSAL